MVELPRVTFIVGLCGAGKSGLANELNDPFQVHDGFWDPAERRATYQLLVNAVRQGQSATVTEIAFCTQENRDEILRWLKKDLPDLVPEFIFFDNDVAQSNKNCRDRAEAQVEINKRLTKSYIIPSGADRRKVWSDPRPVEPDDPETLYTQEEIDLMIRMPLTTDILLSAFRNATGALALFGSDVLQPEVARIPNPSDQENAIAITLYRLLAYLKTCYELGERHQFQSLSSATRSILELSVDAILLSDLTEPIRAERFHQSTEILRYLAAKKLVAFYDKRPDLPFPPDSGPQRQLVDTPGLEARLDALSQRLWNLPLNKAPTHWTKQDLSARCASVGDDFTLIYQHEVAILNWHVHAGGAGVGGIPVEGFKLMEVLARRIITKAVPKAYRAIGAAFGLDQKVQNFGRRLEILEGYASLAGIDARLRAVGHPGNLAPLGRLK